MQKGKTKQSKEPTEFFIDFANHGNKALPGKLIDPKNSLEMVRLERSKVSEIQPKLRKILDGIIKEKELTDSEELQFFTEICEQFRDKYKVSDGKLITTKEYDSARKWNWEVYSEWVQNLSFSLIDFLSNSKTDLRKIKKCQLCKEYYIAKQLRDNRKFCSKKCKRMNQWPREKWNEYMKEHREQKRKEMKKLSEEALKKEIYRRMKEGMTEEEVIEQMKYDAEL